jgi:hypothetical protein
LSGVIYSVVLTNERYRRVIVGMDGLDVWMDGWYGWMDGIDGWMDGIDGWMDGWYRWKYISHLTLLLSHLPTFSPILLSTSLVEAADEYHESEQHGTWSEQQTEGSRIAALQRVAVHEVCSSIGSVG